MNNKKILGKIGLVLLSLGIGFVVAEGLLRLRLPVVDRLCVFPPHLNYKLEPDSTNLNGISGTKHFTTDRLGIRPLGANNPDEYEMLFIGGSTTECLYLDDKETWAYLLAQKLHAKGGSIGKSGQTSIDHFMQVKYFVPQLPRLKRVVIMCGLNDMLKALADSNQSRGIESYKEDSLYKSTFTHSNQFASSRGLRLIQLFKSVYRQIVPDATGQVLQDIHGYCYQQWRAHRASAKNIMNDLNPKHAARMAEYACNINAIITTAQRQHLNIIFIAQVAAWRDSMSADEQKKLWMGGTGRYQLEGGHSYYSTALLSNQLAQYNELTKAVCQKREVLFIESKNFDNLPSYFYDDCHFTEQGAKKFSDWIYLSNIAIAKSYL